MELQQVDVFIEKNGEVRIEVRGVKGKKCPDLTAGLEEALGGKLSREMTPDAVEAEGEAVRQSQEQHRRIG